MPSISAPGVCWEFGKLGARNPVPNELAGATSPPIAGAAWTIARDGETWTMAVSGPLIAGGPPWTARGLDADTIEIVSPASWITATPARPSRARQCRTNHRARGLDRPHQEDAI